MRAAMVAPSAPMPYLPYVLIKPETYAGVKSYQVSLILDLIFSAFALTIALAVILVSAADPITASGFLSVVGAAACGLVIVFVINFIVSLMSVMKMHHGSREYGAEHERYATRGVVFKWLGTTMSTAAAVLVVYLLLSGLLFATFAGPVSSSVYIPLLITIFWTVGVTFKGQMYRNFVRALQPPEAARWSRTASLVIPVLGVLGVITVGAATARILGAFGSPATITPVELFQLSQVLVGGVFLPPGLAIFGYILFYVVYSRTERRLTQGLYQTYQQITPPGAWPGMVVPAPAAVMPTYTPVPPAAPAEPRTCPRCGQVVDAAYAYCQHCGTKIGA